MELIQGHSCLSNVKEKGMTPIMLTFAFFFRLNEQLKPILDLLRETENVVLASEVLNPSPQGVKKVYML